MIHISENKTFYYARVSSNSQSLARQIEAFKKDGADERDIITEKKSGKNMDREAYQTLRNQLLRTGDSLVVMSLDRLGRNKEQIKEELQYFKNNGIRVRILDIPTSNLKPPEGQEWIIDMVNNILIEVLASQAEQERKTIRKRQAEGIAIAKEQGKYKGGTQKEIDEELYEYLFLKYKNRELTKKEMAVKLGVSRPTLDKIIERHRA